MNGMRRERKTRKLWHIPDESPDNVEIIEFTAKIHSVRRCAVRTHRIRMVCILLLQSRLTITMLGIVTNFGDQVFCVHTFFSLAIYNNRVQYLHTSRRTCTFWLWAFESEHDILRYRMKCIQRSFMCRIYFLYLFCTLRGRHIGTYTTLKRMPCQVGRYDTHEHTNIYKNSIRSLFWCNFCEKGPENWIDFECCCCCCWWRRCFDLSVVLYEKFAVPTLKPLSYSIFISMFVRKKQKSELRQNSPNATFVCASIETAKANSYDTKVIQREKTRTPSYEKLGVRAQCACDWQHCLMGKEDLEWKRNSL